MDKLCALRYSLECTGPATINFLLLLLLLILLLLLLLLLLPPAAVDAITRYTRLLSVDVFNVCCVRWLRLLDSRWQGVGAISTIICEQRTGAISPAANSRANKLLMQLQSSHEHARIRQQHSRFDRFLNGLTWELDRCFSLRSK